MSESQRVDALMARIVRLEQEGRDLKHEVRALREAARDRSSGSDDANGGGPVSRRRLLGMAGAAAAAGLGGAVAASAPAGATTGNMQFGAGNDAGADTTSLTSTNATAAFTVNASTVDAIGVNAVGANNTAVKGSAGFGSGVHGVSTTGGVGVRAGSQTGYGLRIDGPADTGMHAYVVPGVPAGPPASGTHAVGEFWMGSTGILFQCTVAGAPGTWVQMPQLGREQTVVPTTTTHLTGTITNGDPILWATASGSGRGVCGQAPGGIGLVGDTDSGIAVRAGVNNGAAGVHLELFPTSQTGPPTSGAHALGQFYMDSAGVLFQCVVAGSSGTWVRQAPLVTLASPVRVYDSRSGQPNQAPNTQGSLTFTSAPPSSAFREVACNKNASSGTTVVPAGARTLLMNLAIVSISGVGALNAYATGTTQPATANINWSAGGQVLSNAVTSACSATQHVNFAIVASTGAATHFIVDVIGYYL